MVCLQNLCSVHVWRVGLSRGWSVGISSIHPHYISENARFVYFIIFSIYDVPIYEDFGMNQVPSLGTHGYELECMRLSSIFCFLTKERGPVSKSRHLFESFIFL